MDSMSACLKKRLAVNLHMRNEISNKCVIPKLLRIRGTEMVDIRTRAERIKVVSDFLV